jgi:hypothetical protein
MYAGHTNDIGKPWVENHYSRLYYKNQNVIWIIITSYDKYWIWQHMKEVLVTYWDQPVALYWTFYCWEYAGFNCNR